VRAQIIFRLEAIASVAPAVTTSLHKKTVSLRSLNAFMTVVTFDEQGGQLATGFFMFLNAEPRPAEDFFQL
jgi:hypothetical protein